MIIATAGHVDHGKTALVRALTGVDTDRLPEEKHRGISIDLGFAYWRPKQDMLLAFVDVPGHERFVHNMLAGVCGIDAVLFVVAADDGVMAQTIEHLQIVKLLGIGRGVAVINKVDRVPRERAEDIKGKLRALLASMGLAELEVLTVSAITGEGLDRLRDALATLAQNGARESEKGPFRFCIDRSFTIAGAGTVVTGTVFGGTVATGERLTITPAGISARVRDIQKDGKPAASATSGERCALNLAGVDILAAARGNWVVAPALHAPTSRMDVRLSVVASEKRPLEHWTPVHLHHGASDVTARVLLRNQIVPGGFGLAQLISDKPVAALRGDRFIIRDQSAARTIGGGHIIDPFAPRRVRDRAQRLAQLLAIEFGEPRKVLMALQEVSPDGIDVAWLKRLFSMDDLQMYSLIEISHLVIVGKIRKIALQRHRLEAVQRRITDTLADFHARTPNAIGMELEDLRAQSAVELSAQTFDAVLRRLASEKQIEMNGSAARLHGHLATNNESDERTWQHVRPILHSAGLNGLTITELAAVAKIEEPALRNFLFRKAKTGDLVKVSAERFYLRGTLARFAAIAAGVARSVPGGSFTAAQVRDRTDIGRTRVIEILECFDRIGITSRVADLRKLRKNSGPILGEPE